MTESRVILITGASSGIGSATALAFARRGWDVVGLARRSERLEALRVAVAALPPGHGDLLPLEADVRDGDALRAAVAVARAQWGRLDVVVANAGLGQRGALADSAWDDLETVIRTNVDGVLHTIRSSIPALRETRGQVVIISSVTAELTTPYTAVYGASKAFVSSVARALRLELESDGIAVTDMLVGRTETEFNARRLGQEGAPSGRKGVPVMTAETVAEAIYRAVERRSKRVVLRPFDNLLLLAHRLFPDLIGRMALRQYK